MQCACAILSSMACPAVIFQHYFINDTIVKKEFNGYKMFVLIFSSAFVRNICRSKKKWTRWDRKWMSVFISSTRYSCQILMKLEFPWQVFEKHSNIKFHENFMKIFMKILPVGTELFRTDRRTGMAKLIFAFRNFVNASRNYIFKYCVPVFMNFIRCSH